MSDERRYDDEEIAEILTRATAGGSGPARLPARVEEGLTLSQVEEIGSEVGIAPARIAEAARAVASRDVAGPRSTFLGTPRSVSRVVHIARALDEEEWTRLVVDLRATFGAQGHVTSHGPLRSWTNSNLQVHVEPDGEGYRVRMQTLKGNIGPLVRLSAGLIAMAVVMLLLSIMGEAEPATMVMAALFALAGLGEIAYLRAALPGWADERAAQMEALAGRIPLLLKERPK